jgi:hypothetical protein
MKQYSVRRGTDGFLLTRDGTLYKSTQWKTRRDLAFTETVVDPISYHNNRGRLNLPEPFIRLAERGYTIFGGDSGGEMEAHMLAIKYNEVVVA